MEYISKKRLYLDAEGKVTEDELKGVSLLVGEGGTLDEPEAKKYGLDSSGDSSSASRDDTINDDEKESQSKEKESDDQSGLTITEEKIVEDKAIPSPGSKKKRGRPPKSPQNGNPLINYENN